MNGRLVLLVVALVVCVAWWGGRRGAAAGEASDGPRVQFNRDIRPILSDTCFKCHGPDDAAREAKLRLDVREGALAERRGRFPIVPGDAGASEAYRRIASHDPGYMMPPPESNLRLTAEQKDLIGRWIEQGAEYEEHWALIPPRRPELPAVRDARWVRNPIDRFILHRLESEGMRPSPEASRAALVRRVTLDLTGLPPTLEELDRALADEAPDWYERLVDRLLDSPRYGEHMAVDWLDQARYADTHGYHIDSHRDMWLWRAWVIGAFNRNLPFDQFTVEQLAGDMLAEAGQDQIIATGFNRNHMINFEGGAVPEEYHAAYIVDRVNTTGTVWLGLTISCAQCHDHKYDPISQREYYQLYAFFHNVPETPLDGIKGNAAPFIEVPEPEQAARLAAVDEQIAAMEAERAKLLPQVDAAQGQWEAKWADAEEPSDEKNVPKEILELIRIAAEDRTDEQRKKLAAHYQEKVADEAAWVELREALGAARKEREAANAAIPTTMVMREMDEPRETFVLIRGEYDKKGERVEAGVPAALGPMPEDAPRNRLGLAQWLVSGEHPLTARVTVNRYWQRYFGYGIVKTADDFGSQAEWPVHPELLDWLAREFVRSGWDVKAMQRLLVTSAAYRQHSAVRPELAERDPENRLLARGPRFRMSAEMIRDHALAASGLLVEKLGGPSVKPYQPPGLWREMAHGSDPENSIFSAQVYRQDHGEALYRRTMYTFWKRTVPPPSLATFDAPDREICTARRLRTNTPLQALVLMNAPTYVEASRKLAERVLTEGPATVEQRVAFAFRTAAARELSAQERAILVELYERRLAAYREDPSAAEQLLGVGESEWNEHLDPVELAAWAAVANVILGLDETVTKG